MTARGSVPGVQGVPGVRRRPVVVVEPEHAGHRMLYFAAVAEHLLARDTAVTLATSAAGLRSDDLALRVPGVADRIGRIVLGDDDVAVASPAAVVRIVARLQERCPDAEILVTEGDKFLPAAAVVRAGLDWSRLRVLVMRTPTGRGGPRARLQDAVKAAAMRWATHRGAHVRVLEQATAPRSTYRTGRGHWPSVPDPVDVVPDAAVPPEVAGLPRTPGGVWMGVLGHVSPRKNLDLVLDAARLAGPHVGVLVAGRLGDAERTRCADAIDRFTAAGGRLAVVDRLLGDAELDACVRWVDAVALAHSSEGPSGILGKAVALGTPVLAAGALSLRDEVGRLDAGVWAPLRAADLAAALADLTAAPRAARRPRSLAGSPEFARALLDDPGSP